MDGEPGHIPVLVKEVVALLRPNAGGSYIDGTVGAGGHAGAILEASAPSGRLLAIDRDPQALAHTRERLQGYGDRVTLAAGSYAQMDRYARLAGMDEVDGILLDLGLSSRQLGDAERGFSFMIEGPLDMRFDQTTGETAAELINELPARELGEIFWRYGEVRDSRRLAQELVSRRPIATTMELADIVASFYRRHGRTGRRRRIHPATTVFQALRVAVNDELDVLQQGLETAVGLLRSGGRLAVIAFHSLEDRLVKQQFREWSRPADPFAGQPAREPEVLLLSRKAVKASESEISTNPRSRSARLRVVERL